MIFICFQAKLQLFQEYRALFENFFGSYSKKALRIFRDDFCGYVGLHSRIRGKKAFVRPQKLLG